ncbi:InlB B-repeat-containing protein, partial [Nocardioides sp.]|uniref:InlB B-repeat-containing protein n=1 Tax=Nocardioides sp. TaxID=35761 RepID=UPI0031FE7F3F|nr:inlA [Nocardioides sp.]
LYDFSIQITGANTVHAHWSLNSYTVTFDANGGSTVADQAVDYSDPAALPTEPTRTGYTFTGWYSAASGGTLYDFTDPITGTTQLTAYWSLNSYTVTFDANGGGTVADQTVAYGDPATLPTEPTRTGYTFTGWYSAASGSTLYDFTNPITGAQTLYAHWTADTPTPATDTDHDGVSDVDEVVLGTDPTNPDTDGDGLTDGQEVTGSENTFNNCATDPLRKDTDRDGLSDGLEIHGINLHRLLVLPGNQVVDLGLVKPNPCSHDTDKDGLRDGREIRGFPTRKLHHTYRSNPVTADSDQDGLGDRAEVTGSANRRFARRPTDPMNWDTDRGGVSDGREVRSGSDPTDDTSGPGHPRLQTPWGG